MTVATPLCSTFSDISLLASILNEPCFDYLRTKEQLGYIVFSGKVVDDGILGLRIIVQSAKCAPKELDEHIEAFLTSFRKKLANISEEEFCKQRDSLIISCLKKPKSMIDETFLYVSERKSKTYTFDRKWKLASELDQLSLNDVVSFFDHFVAKGAAKRRKLSIRIVGKSNDVKKSQINEADFTNHEETVHASQTEVLMSYGASENGEIVINDLDQFKRSMCLYPVEASDCKKKCVSVS